MMRCVFAGVLAGCLAWGSAGLVDAQDKAETKKKGPATGKAPSFALKDQNGKVRRLEELTKKGNVALVFYRSASW